MAIWGVMLALPLMQMPSTLAFVGFDEDSGVAGGHCWWF
jgi:hypothetical protein